MSESVQQYKFEVIVLGQSTSLEDWGRSLQAPLSELPELTDEQKAFARKFGITDEQYARSRLSLTYGKERMLKRGAALGKEVEKILREYDHKYQLIALIYEATKLRWVAQVQTDEHLINIAIPIELADDVVDSNTVQDQKRLKTLLRSSLEQGNLASDRERT